MAVAGARAGRAEEVKAATFASALEKAANDYPFRLFCSHDAKRERQEIKFRSRLLTHTYAWRNDPAGCSPAAWPPKRPTLYGRRCRILATGKLGSALIEFENGQREVTSRRALRRG